MRSKVTDLDNRKILPPLGDQEAGKVRVKTASHTIPLQLILSFN